MNIFVVNIAVTLLLGALLLAIQPSERKKRIYIALMTVNWVCISGLRRVDIGADTLVYKGRFQRTAMTSWRHLFESFYLVYVDEEGKDPGYSVFEKVVQIFTDNYQVYLVVVAVLFFVGLAYWI